MKNNSLRCAAAPVCRFRTGLPVPHVDLEIVSPEGRPLPHDGKTTGEIVVRSPWLTQGYLNDPEKSEALWTDGWLPGYFSRACDVPAEISTARG